MARHFDLAIVGQVEPGKALPEELIAEGALLESGRPVLLGYDLRTVILLLSGLLPGSAAALTAYSERLALKAQARQYDREPYAAPQDRQSGQLEAGAPDGWRPGITRAAAIARHGAWA